MASKTNEELRQRAEFVEKVIDAVREPLLVLTPDLCVHSANESFYRMFRVSPEATTGAFVYDLGNGQWNIPALRHLLEGILPHQRSFDDYLVTHEFEDIGRRTMRLNARRIDSIDFILLAIEDVTESEDAAERARLVAQEVDHRAKNILALVQAIIQITRAPTVDAFVASVMGRLDALARVHSLLTAGHGTTVDLRHLIEGELAPYCDPAGGCLTTNGPPVTIGPDAAQAIGMLLHELATNAVKHGALTQAGGRVDINWSYSADEGLALRWTESDGPPVHAPQATGLGTMIIERTVRAQMGGRLDWTWRHDGLTCEVAIPAAKLASRPD